MENGVYNIYLTLIIPLRTVPPSTFWLLISKTLWIQYSESKFELLVNSFVEGNKFKNLIK